MPSSCLFQDFQGSEDSSLQDIAAYLLEFWLYAIDLQSKTALPAFESLRVYSEFQSHYRTILNLGQISDISTFMWKKSMGSSPSLYLR